MNTAKLVNGIIIFVSPDIEKTVGYYRDVFGCTVVEHYEHEEKFAALYRDEVEFICVQLKSGNYVPNSERYGAGYDAYLDPDTVEGVDSFYNELKQNGAEIVVEPHLEPDGCYEFVVKDIDNRLIGIGRIKDKDTFFKGVSIK